VSAIIAAETLLLAVLVVLVVGLLRSHAEILRRLGPDGEALGAPPPTTPRRSDSAPAPAISGTTPTGDALTLAFESSGGIPTLLAFLTSGCTTCVGFWETLPEQRLPGGIQTVIVAKGPDRERPARIRELAPDGVSVVLSSRAWEDYEVPGAPYFVLVNQTIRGEGVATSWHALNSLISDAIVDQREAKNGGDGPGRALTIDQKFAAAGIGPDHPSLYPEGRD
jgi:hypothetical protein